ncbi:PIN domain-containing protein [Candidatus Woesebacteria bacterium]|nr:PIN domain-containing protein [Candidatus Woesebacteria bacterium]
MKVFVDSDVILDVILEREEFIFSQKLLDLLLTRKIAMLTSPIVFTNSFYIIRKLKGRDKAHMALKKMRKLFNVCVLNEKTIDKALASGFKDFEDAIQYYCALESKIKYLVTRNKKDYVGDEVCVISPQEAIALFEKN